MTVEPFPGLFSSAGDEAQGLVALISKHCATAWHSGTMCHHGGTMEKHGECFSEAWLQ